MLRRELADNGIELTREEWEQSGYTVEYGVPVRVGRAGIAVPALGDDGTVALDREEFPRPGTTMESLAELKTVFDQFMPAPIDDTGETFDQLVKRAYPDLKINHVHHAGNSSGVVDGAAALVLSSKEYADKVGWKPRARIKCIATVGGDPTLMLNEPVPAAKKVLARAGMTTNDIDLFEVNEAFSVVAAKFIRDLELDPEIVTNALLDRESLGPTGVGHGIALPHARLDDIENIVGLFPAAHHWVSIEHLRSQQTKPLA